MALIAVVQQNVVDRKLLSQETMLDGVSLALILPGPVSINVVAYVGHCLRGKWGAFVSTVGVLLPSFLLMLLLSWLYFTVGKLPVINKMFMGFMPAVTAIIIYTVVNMGRKTITGKVEAGIALASLCLISLHGGVITELGIIGGSGLLGYVIFRSKLSASTQEESPEPSKPQIAPPVNKLHGSMVAPLFMSMPLLSVKAALVLKLFTTFAGISLLLFGGGYVFIPMIQHMVVSNGWLTLPQFSDAIALSQIMPGPIVMSCVFVGYKVAGFWGALSATFGLFLPPAVLMIFAAGVLNRIKTSIVIKAILCGVRPAVIGMIGAAVISVGSTVSVQWISLLLFVAALIALFKYKLGVIWIIPLSGLIGILVY